MKKHFLALFIFMSAGFLFPLFADSKNIVYSQTFDFFELDSVNVSLTFETLQISRIYGDEIVVEIGSNNINKLPQAVTQNRTLKITSKVKKASRGDKCTVYLYLPQDFNPQEIIIQNVSGNISADILKSQNKVSISNVSGRSDINACQTELFKVLSVSGNATLQKIAVDFFEFNSTSGTIFAELEAAPFASSSISSVSGKTQLYIPKNSNLDLSASSITGTIKPLDSDKKNAGTYYQTTTGTGGPQISISSVSGKIEFTAY